MVPPSRAVWVPAGVAHETRSHAAVQFRALLIDPTEAPGLPDTCAVVAVTPLLRELILRLAALADTPRPPGFGPAVTHLLLLELAFLPVEPLSLPRPRHLRLQRLCQGIRDDPAASTSVIAAAAALHMSRSSFMRLFQRETGMGFAHWRQQARLLHALAVLAEGQSILNVALACGYDSPSAFAAMFRRSLGRPPSDYFANRGGTARSIGSPIETSGAGGRPARPPSNHLDGNHRHQAPATGARNKEAGGATPGPSV